MDVLLTTQQAAHILKRSPRTIYRLMQAGQLTPERRLGEGPNAQYLFRGADIEALLAKRNKTEKATT